MTSMALGGPLGRRGALGGSSGALWVAFGPPLGGPLGPLGVLWRRLGGHGGPRGILGDQLLPKGGLAESVVLSYECIHLESRSLLGRHRVGQVLDQDGRWRGKCRPRRPQQTKHKRGRDTRDKYADKNNLWRVPSSQSTPSCRRGRCSYDLPFQQHKN